ncbi:Glucomannan 4-beta-mannosyltransferase 2, partial [Mucuna pruriens]
MVNSQPKFFILKSIQGANFNFAMVYMDIVIILVKLFSKKLEQRYKYEPLQDDEELGNFNFPIMLMQILMFNEKRKIKFSSYSKLKA